MNSPTLQRQAAQPVDVLDGVEAFIREYLVCDDHQLAVLTLWSAYTWCFPSFLTAPYLDIRSAEPQSGKSVGLLLLSSLCRSSLLVHGASSGTLFSRLLDGRSLEQIKLKEQRNLPLTLLLDDCHHSFGPSERQPVLALLNSGSQVTSVFALRGGNYSTYGPKAFAGNFPLPQSLASRCIPIVLRRRKASDPVRPFLPDDLEPLIDSFQSWFQNWSEENSNRLAENRNKPIQLPPGLTPRQQQCAEPLVRVANLIGGRWPAKTRTALSALFSAAGCSVQVQLLRDLRALFRMSNNPEQLPSRDLLAYLCNLENRPWSSWGRKSGQRLASLLHPLGIFSRDIRVGEDSLKGYRLQDFQDAWERYACVVAENAATQQNAATA